MVPIASHVVRAARHFSLSIDLELNTVGGDDPFGNFHFLRGRTGQHPANLGLRTEGDLFCGDKHITQRIELDGVSRSRQQDNVSKRLRIKSACAGPARTIATKAAIAILKSAMTTFPLSAT